MVVCGNFGKPDTTSIGASSRWGSASGQAPRRRRCARHGDCLGARAPGDARARGVPLARVQVEGVEGLVPEATAESGFGKVMDELVRRPAKDRQREEGDDAPAGELIVIALILRSLRSAD